MPGHRAIKDQLLAAPKAVDQIVRSQPEQVILAVVIGGLVAAIGFFLWRRYRGTRAGEIVRAIRGFDSLAIVMHPNPDPDAMGSAIGLAELAETKGIDSTLYYPGEIRHQENRAFRTVLDLDLERLQGASDFDEEAVALVDHNEPRGFTGAGGISPEIVIDHHPGGGEGSTFSDVRPEYGACASIIAEYFEALDAEMLGDTNDQVTDGGSILADGGPYLSEDVATGLLYGIQADTRRMSKGCTTAEFAACSYLFPGADEDLLDRIANPQVTSGMLETKAEAISNRVINGSFAISDVGEVEDVDSLPQAADELARLEGVTAVVVYGSKDGVIHLSGRSRDDRVHMGQIMEAVLEEIPMSSGGGHARMGGGQVPLEYLAGLGPSQVEPERARADLRGSLFNAMKGNV